MHFDQGKVYIFSSYNEILFEYTLFKGKDTKFWNL